MAKLTLTDITSGYASTTTINANNAATETALENTLSRDGTSPNTMGADLDMNSNNIKNLAAPVNDNDAVRLTDVDSVSLTSATAVTTTISDTGGYFTSSNVEGALQEVADGFTFNDTTLTGNTIVNTSGGGQFQLNSGGAGFCTISIGSLTSGRLYQLPDVNGTFITTGNLTDITTTGTVTSGTWGTGAVIADCTMTLGSDADGDIYYRSGNVLTRLAKGTAGQVLRMNSGATAPEWTAGSTIQKVISTTSAIKSTTTLMPAGGDETIVPVKTDGVEISTAAITPTNSNNTLLIETTVVTSFNTGTQHQRTIALFQDDNTNAIAAAGCGEPGGNLETIDLVYKMTAGTTSETTFKIRGGSTVAGTFYANANPIGVQLYGGVVVSSLRITEIQV